MKKPLFSIRQNIISLAVLQGSDYLIPLLVIPYLLRVLGSEGYGKIAFIQAFFTYFVLIVDYGFNWTGTKKIAANNSSKEMVARILFDVQLVKLIILCSSVFVVVLLGFYFSRLNEYGALFYIGLLPLFGAALYPLWYMQGIEAIREAAAIMFGVRLLLLVFVFLFVRSSEDLLLAGIFQMGSTPIAGVLAWLYLGKKGHLRWGGVSINSIKRELMEGRHAFLASASSSIYRTSNTVVLGFIAGPVAVAYYNLAEKLVKATQELSRPIAQATFPRVSAYAAESKKKAIILLRKIFFSIGGLCLLTSVTLFIFSAEIVDFFSGPGYEKAALVLRCMSFIPFVGGVNSVLGVLTMHSFGFSSKFSSFVLVAGVVNVALIFPMVTFFAEIGAAFSFFASEVTLMFLLLKFHKKNKINLFKVV